MITMKRYFRLFVTLLLTLYCASAAAEDKFKVAILLFDEVQIIDFAAPYEVFGHANFEVFTVSKDGKPIQTVMGLDVTPKYSFANMPTVDAVVIPGGNVHDAMEDANIQNWLKAQKKTAKHLLSVCTGSHILAEAGLLDGQSATTFHRAIDWLQNDYPKIDIQRDKRFVDNGQIIVSAGLSSGMDASLHLVGKVLGMDRAKTIAMHIEYDWNNDNGFVRATMADTRLPNNKYDWPKGVEFALASSYGDDDYWQKTYKVTTKVAKERLVAAFAKAMTAHDDWLLQKSANQHQFTWKGAGANNNWRLQLEVVEATQPNQLVFRVDVKRES